MSLLVSRSARDSLDLDPRRFGPRGRIVLTSFTAARHLALAIDHQRKAGLEGEPGVTAGELAALALLDDLYQRFLSRYIEERSPALLSAALDSVLQEVGRSGVEEQLRRFAEIFELSDPPDTVPIPSPGSSVAKRRLRDLLLFHLQRRNRAAGSITRVLHAGFEPTDDYRLLVAALERFLGGQPGLDGGEQSLLATLLAPLLASPDSLTGQLRYILEHWGALLGQELWRIQGVLDLFAEEEAVRFGPGYEQDFSVPWARLATDEERYSPDREWMPGLVLLAKNAFVWLDQLSRQYGRSVTRLDQIPEEELALLVQRGFTGLWLIGVWERSQASKRIKQLRGNPEAAASAYSLKGYRIAEGLGGEPALAVLESRATRHGLHLAADMVPNHLGIDSDWVVEHPERFLLLDESPFPVYRFSGEDFSPTPGVGIYLEDHYFDGTDAAVVFKRLDRSSGETRFIYHGNDGTSTPWNDTAQLDYLEPEVREAVIRSILDVARRFPVIRFDAAMTLAKRHYQRLWFPEPGSAGAVPSRAEHGMSREEFNRRMPEEFWREVVDRVAVEAPDTLLLAEAFWLMEGYFVRTLGMHRVYNSAFMHMMRDQETGKYRRLLKEVLAFDPEILRRYVNFMSNPDEAPASAQFGRGDRYFGVCAAMVTLPGLPMFGHGQWEGFDEKYGMEYQRAYYDERPLPEIVERHDREIAPLLRLRELFAGVESFLLFDFVDPDGSINENVLAFFNADAERKFVVVFNNGPNRARGSISQSVPSRVKGAAGEGGGLHARTVGAALGVSPSPPILLGFRDQVLGLQFLHRAADAGELVLSLEIEPFQCLALTDFSGVGDDELGSYALLADHLSGRGVPHLDQALFELRMEPLCRELGEIAAGGEEVDGASRDLIDGLAARLEEMLAGAPWRDPVRGKRAAEEFIGRSRALLRLRTVEDLTPPTMESRAAIEQLGRWSAETPAAAFGLWAAALLSSLGEPLDDSGEIDRWIGHLVAHSGVHGDTAERVGAVLRLAHREAWLDTETLPGVAELARIVERWAGDNDARHLLGCHRAKGAEWLVREKLEELIDWRFALAVTAWLRDRPADDGVETAQALIGFRLAGQRLMASAERAGYRVTGWTGNLQARLARTPELKEGVRPDE